MKSLTELGLISAKDIDRLRRLQEEGQARADDLLNRIKVVINDPKLLPGELPQGFSKFEESVVENHKIDVEEFDGIKGGIMARAVTVTLGLPEEQGARMQYWQTAAALGTANPKLLLDMLHTGKTTGDQVMRGVAAHAIASRNPSSDKADQEMMGQARAMDPEAFERMSALKELVNTVQAFYPPEPTTLAAFTQKYGGLVTRAEHSRASSPARRAEMLAREAEAVRAEADALAQRHGNTGRPYGSLG